MISGRRAFERETAAETMTAVLREDPADLTGPRGPVPLAFEQLVRHCLEKNPEERFQSARDLSFALQSASSASTSSREVAPARFPSKHFSRPVVALATLLAATVSAFALGFMLSRASSRAPYVLSFQQVTDRAGVETSPTLSPDGKTFVHVSDVAGNADLYSLRVGGRAAVLLTPDAPDDDTQPAFSPDGERIAFRSSREGGGIFLMNATGESVRRLTDYGFNPSWSPDGREIVLSPTTYVYPTDRPGVTDQGLVTVDVATARKRTVSTRVDAMQPSWSPHGTRIAYWGLRGFTGQRDLWTIAADGSDAERGGTTVTDDAALDWSPAWSADGRYLYFSSNRGGTMNLWRVPIDERSGRVLGDPEPADPREWPERLCRIHRRLGRWLGSGDCLAINDVPTTSPKDGDRQPAAVRRPDGEIRALERRDALETTAVGPNRPHLIRAAAVGIERDVLPVRRPDRSAIAEPIVGQPTVLAAVGPRDEQVFLRTRFVVRHPLTRWKPNAVRVVRPIRPRACNSWTAWRLSLARADVR